MGDFAKEPPAKRQKSTQEIREVDGQKILQTGWDGEIRSCSIKTDNDNMFFFVLMR